MMPLPALFRLIFLLLVGMACAPALAQLDVTYEGRLIPETFDTPMPITLQLKEQSGRLTGTARTGSPYPGTTPITSGDSRNGQCNVKIQLSPSTTLRLSGSCLTQMFEGRYVLNAPGNESPPKGLFRLIRKEVKTVEDESGSGRSPAPSSGSLTDCIRANTRCLLACPQGDYNTEFLCSNRCRSKYQACKAKFSTTPSSRSFGGTPSPDAGMLSSPSR